MEKLTSMTGLIAPDSVFEFQITDSEDTGRIDRVLANKFPYYSRSFFQALIEKKLIALNGQLINKPSTPVKLDDMLTVTFPAKQDREHIKSEVNKLGIEIVFENPHFFIIFKPAGIMMHPTQTNNLHATVTDWLLTHHHEIADVGPVDRPGIVHRLDKDTSGLVIIPRTNYAHGIFGDMFKNRLIQKTYVALVHGNPDQTGKIDFAIGRHPIHRKKMTAFPSTNYKNLFQLHQSDRSTPVRSSLTHYTVKEQFEGAALVEVKPVTGRTHQIRVHMAAIGHGLLGDSTYGVSSPLIDRQALHAQSLQFTFEGTDYFFEKEMPEDMQSATIALREKTHTS